MACGALRVASRGSCWSSAGSWCARSARYPSSFLRVQGAGCRVQGAGCRVQGAGCRVEGGVARELQEQRRLGGAVARSGNQREREIIFNL